MTDYDTIRDGMYHADWCYTQAQIPGDCNCGKDEAEQALDRIEQAQQWIPVSERLPKGKGCYAVVIKSVHEDGTTTHAKGSKMFDGNVFYGVASSAEWAATVTHWMPLPELPKESSDD